MMFSYLDKVGTNMSNLEPETVAIVKWMNNHPFVLSATLNGGTILATYPFDSIHLMNNHKMADDAIFRHLASGYAKLHHTMHYGQPSCPGLSVNDKYPGGISPGFKWKNKVSSMKDYNYLRKNCFEVSLYLGCCQFPFPNTLQNFWKVNRESLVRYIYEVSENFLSVNCRCTGRSFLYNIKQFLSVLCLFDKLTKIST